MKKKTLDEAIEQVSKTIVVNSDYELVHEQLLEWLKELKTRRAQSKQLIKDRVEAEQELENIRNNFSVSDDSNINVKVQISRFGKGRVGAKQISAIGFDAVSIRDFRRDILMDTGSQVLGEVVQEFMKNERP